jgi:hypothetical protein
MRRIEGYSPHLISQIKAAAIDKIAAPKAFAKLNSQSFRLAVNRILKLWRIGGCERADPRVLFCQMLERAAWLAGRILAELFQAGAAW